MKVFLKMSCMEPLKSRFRENHPHTNLLHLNLQARYRLPQTLTLKDFNEYHNVCTIYQVVHGLNARLCELVPISYPQHTYCTRNTDHIYGKERKLVCTGHSVVCRGPLIWNRLDASLKKVRSFSKFKRKIKDLLMSPYGTE